MPTPKLPDQVRIVARLKHYSLSTEKAYVGWIRRFILFHNKQHPEEKAETEIRQCLSHLALDTRVSASTQTVALSALLFLYRDVLKTELAKINQARSVGPQEMKPDGWAGFFLFFRRNAPVNMSLRSWHTGAKAVCARAARSEYRLQAGFSVQLPA